MADRSEQGRSPDAFDLRVPGGTITVAGEENSLGGYRCSPEHDHVHVLGHAVGYPESTANILLEDYDVNGSAEVPTTNGDVLAKFKMDETDEGYILRVELRQGSAPSSTLW